MRNWNDQPVQRRTPLPALAFALNRQLDRITLFGARGIAIRKGVLEVIKYFFSIAVSQEEVKLAGINDYDFSTPVVTTNGG